MNLKKPLVGVTGIIGSGKSTVADLFDKMDCVVFNSDAMVRNITQEPETLQEIQKEFGTEILTSTSQLDREKMAQLVFKDPSELKKLNQIIHPKVRERMWKFVEMNELDFYVKMNIIDSPLIYETDLHKFLDVIVVVNSPKEQCVERVKKRNNLSRREILDRMSKQIPLENKVKLADFVINNDKNIEDLNEQVAQVYKQIISQWSFNP